MQFRSYRALASACPPHGHREAARAPSSCSPTDLVRHLGTESAADSPTAPQEHRLSPSTELWKSRPVSAVVCRARQRVAALNMGRMAALLSSGAGGYTSTRDSVDAGLHALDATAATRPREIQRLGSDCELVCPLTSSLSAAGAHLVIYPAVGPQPTRPADARPPDVETVGASWWPRSPPPKASGGPGAELAEASICKNFHPHHHHLHISVSRRRLPPPARLWARLVVRTRS